MSQIEVINLTKSYTGGTIANKSLSFNVEKGEIIGLLGKNGAGKTTLLSLLGKEFLPKDGYILINGKPISEIDSSMICIVQQELGLFDFLTVSDHFKYFSILRSTKSQIITRQTIEKIIRYLKLEPLLKRKTINLSSGEKRRVILALALITNSEIILLDEPTENLDIEWKNYIIDFIYSLSYEQGKTIIYSSHNIEEVERITSKVLILNKGELLFFDKIENIIEKLPYNQKVVIRNHKETRDAIEKLKQERFDMFLSVGKIEYNVYFNTDNIVFFNNFLSSHKISHSYQAFSIDDFFKLTI